MTIHLRVLIAKTEGRGFSHSVLGTSISPAHPKPISDFFFLLMDGCIVEWNFKSAHRKNRRIWLLPFVTRDIKWSSPAKANKRFCLLAKQQENRQGLVTIRINQVVVTVVASCWNSRTLWNTHSKHSKSRTLLTGTPLTECIQYTGGEDKTGREKSTTVLLTRKPRK